MGYKEEQEAFVSHLSGSTALDILCGLAHVPLLVLLAKLYLPPTQPPSRFRLLLELAFFVIPLLLAFTIASDFHSFSILFIAGCILLQWKKIKKRLTTASEQENSSEEQLNRSYISLFKGSNVLLTCIAIMAVDFSVFPRRLAKTETFGLSLMDVGVGTFVISSALTSKHARGKLNQNSSNSSSMSWMQYLQSMLSIPVRRYLVLLLGVGRMLVIKALDYQEHVSEYGVHWNFFVTLFGVWVTADILHECMSRETVVVVALLSLAAYQVALIRFGLVDFLLSPERTNIFEANKEGILSLCGYVALYLIAEGLSYHCFFRKGTTDPSGGDAATSSTSSTQDVPNTEKFTDKSLTQSAQQEKKSKVESSTAVRSSTMWVTFRKLCLAVASLWLLWYFLQENVQETSRRMCNATYVFLVLANSFTFILLLFVAELLGGGSGETRLYTLDWMNQQSLPVFLAANILTGFINFMMKTIYAPDTTAMAVLVTYCTTVTCIAWYLQYYSAKKKLATSTT